MSAYTKRLTRAEAQAQFEAALAKMSPPLAGWCRMWAEFFEEDPADAALWFQRADVGMDGSAIGAVYEASLAMLAYHNTLVAESIAAEERAAHEAAEEARLAAMAEHWREWALRERPPERIDDVTADEIGEQR